MYDKLQNSLASIGGEIFVLGGMYSVKMVFESEWRLSVKDESVAHCRVLEAS